MTLYRSVVIRFGLPAIVAAFAGATTLAYTADFGRLAEYSVGSHTAVSLRSRWSWPC
jgi:hypothetical protein